MPKGLCRSLCVFFLALTLVPVAYGQTLGEIVGSVSDATGAMIPGASVTVTNTGTNAIRSTQTNAAGLYTAPGLVPGPYVVRVETAGFRPSARSLTLQVQQTARVDFEMEVGEITESIEVTSEAALLTTENTTVGTVIDQRRIQELPLNGRNFLQLVALSPNVTYGFGGQGNNDRQGGHRMGQNMSIAGARAVWNNYTLDGVNNTDPNFNTYVVLPSVEMLQEFKVQTGVYPAEFGRAASQINVSTRGGNNQFHGSAFEFLRNDKMDARSYDFTAADHLRDKNPFQWNQYGFTFGGPIKRDRVFFMSNYEAFRQRTRGNQVYTVPTNAMRQGNFSELSPTNFSLWDPAARIQGPNGIITTQFANNIIPSSRLSPQASVLFEFWPEANSPSESATQPSRNRHQVNRGLVDRDQVHLRFDFVEGSNSNWYGRYSWADDTDQNQGIKLNGSKLLVTAKQYMISNTRTLSPTIVNEFRFGVNTLYNATARELAFVRDVVGELNIPGLSTSPESWGIPRMIVTGFNDPGDSSQGPFVLNNATFQIVDNVSIIRGKHSFRFGGEISRERYNQAGNEFPRGSFEFDGVATRNPQSSASGYAMADFYLGYVRIAESAATTAFHQFRASRQYYYIDDTFRVRPGLTLNFGLRYEFSPPWYDRSEKHVNIDVPLLAYGVVNVPDMNLHPTMVRSGSGDFYENVPFRYPNVQVARDGRLGSRLMTTDKNDFAPRFGIAWSPTSKWTFRSGSGLFYSIETSNSYFDMSRTLAGRVRAFRNDSFPSTTMANFLGTQTGGLPQFPTPYTWAAAHNNRSSYSLHYLFNVQRELTESTVVEFGYMGSLSRRLRGLFDVNEPVPSRGDGRTLAQRTPFPEFGVIQSVHGDGRGHYDSFSTKLTRRFSDGLTTLLGYTWSKSIDNVSAIRGQNDQQAPNTSSCLNCEKAVSGFNTPHRFVGSILYELPLGRGKRWGNNWGGVPNAILGGWQLSSIVTFQSGRTANASGSGGRNSLQFTLGERMNVTGQPLYLSSDTRNTERWFNADPDPAKGAFALNAPGFIGNAGRNVFVGPTQHLWDFGAHKSFQIVEGHSLTFRFEAFNAGNHPVWSTPQVGWGSSNPNVPGANYGKIRGTAVSMRQIQLGLKYSF